MRKIKPLYDRVLVERLEENNRTAGGIVIPPSAQEKAQIGKVIAVGKGCICDDGSVRALIVKEGDKVFFGKYSGTEVDDNHLIIREEEILGIVE
ncbi:co-chaperone GroES [candidate division TM6 bacterium RIFCSPHIGHO2_12_FULL_36_22]|nr:MAG: co-chaperone GroES [candidate division TM6 bacterium RIFCSPHIGHO2_12_FULL_36_22]